MIALREIIEVAKWEDNKGYGKTKVHSDRIREFDMKGMSELPLMPEKDYFLKYFKEWEYKGAGDGDDYAITVSYFFPEENIETETPFTRFETWQSALENLFLNAGEEVTTEKKSQAAMKISQCRKCGSKGRIFKGGSAITPAFYDVMCTNEICNAHTVNCGTKAEAVNLWNNGNAKA